MNNKTDSKRSSLAKRILLAIGTFIVLALCLAIGPLDSFHHGFSSNHVEVEDIPASNLKQTIELGDTPTLLCEFTPQKPHFAGFEIYIANRDDIDSGVLALEVRDSNDQVVDYITVDLSQKNMTSWCHPVIKENLIENDKYYLYGSSYDCSVRPSVQVVDKSYLGKGVNGNVLMGLAYQTSTFSLSEKVFLISMLLCIWAIICAASLFGRRAKKAILAASVVMLATLMFWNYSTSILDLGNKPFGKSFESFQDDSESLVTSTMESEIVGYVKKKSPYGLGRIKDVAGRRSSSNIQTLPSGDGWNNGFSRTKPQVKISNNDYIKKIAVKGNSIRFRKGAEYEIVSTATDDDGKWLTLTLSANGPINESKAGSLKKAVFVTQDGDTYPAGKWDSYESQFGLQGKIFKKIASFFDNYNSAVDFSRLLCSILLAITLIGLVTLIYRKYNLLLAGCFYIVFLLSPWIVNFANNLYWVEFTWFLPMLVGLFCSLNIESRKTRIASYILVFFAVMVKCLCGYEYISTIMISAVAFPIADLVRGVFLKRKDYAICCLRAIIILGLMALLGFLVAIMLHAGYRGDGNLVNGMIDIFQTDVLRRTNGGSLDAFGEEFWPSLTASRWEVLLTYFNFYPLYQCEIITGIPGNLFPIISITPLAILFFDAKNKDVNYQIYALYFLFFLAAISWFVLAKSHSYVHIHMNYVLWYFGFVQLCFYIVLDKARRYCAKLRS